MMIETVATGIRYAAGAFGVLFFLYLSARVITRGVLRTMNEKRRANDGEEEA
jgi:peptidoglycan/LPS O-acetylase OafA/YrhL